MALESSRGELQLWFRPRPDRRLGREVVFVQSPGKKSHLDVASAERCRVYYMGEGVGFPRVRAVVSQVSPRLPMACPNTKRTQNEF
jgi:hypothetical protein